MSQKWGEFWEEVRYEIMMPNKGNNFKKGDNTMHLKPIKSNMTELDLSDTKLKVTVLFSYQTPVAYIYSGDTGYFVTDKFWSRTTSRHINQWAQGHQTKVSQQHIDNLIAEVK